MLWHEQERGERAAEQKARALSCLVARSSGAANEGWERPVGTAVDTCLLGEANRGAEARAVGEGKPTAFQRPSFKVTFGEHLIVGHQVGCQAQCPCLSLTDPVNAT